MAVLPNKIHSHLMGISYCAELQVKDKDDNFVPVFNGKDLKRDEQNLLLIFCIERDTNGLHGKAKAASMKVDVRLCSGKRGYSCFPVAIRFPILLIL